METIVNDIDVIKQAKLNSAFNKNHYEINAPLDNLRAFMIRYAVPLEHRAALDDATKNTISDSEMFNYLIPEFQRDNNKWDYIMKIKFIENLICGASTTLVLGTIPKTKEERGIYCSCKLIDGQQRFTAYLDWINGKFPIFNSVYYNDNLEKELRNVYNLKVRIYQFTNEFEMVKFYIDINENITHSKEDIKKAKTYLAKWIKLSYFSI